MRIAHPRSGAAVVGAVVCGAVSLLLGAGAATAATYPSSGGSFETGPQGWQAPEASCSTTVGGACAASGSFDPANGNPPGSLVATTTVTLNLGGLFESRVLFVSPDFTVREGGPAVLHLERRFSSGGLASLAPQATYRASLVDQTSGTPTEVIAETLDGGDSAFAGRAGAVAVVAGRAYAIAIEALGGSTAGGIGVLGSSAVGFDNVALATGAAAAAGGGPGRGGGGEASASSPRHVFVKVRCPRRPRRACWITAQGKIGKRIRVTYRRTVRVAKGRSKVIALRVKPRFRERVAQRKRLTVLQRIRIGKRTRTVSRSRALIRRS